jgi:thiosulfate dehydrogenase [quinone] large subunit
MGPQTEVAQVPDLVAPSGVAIPADTPSGPEPAATERRGWRARTSRTLRPSDWLYRSHEASFIWLIVRLWLGYQWLNAGYQKIWGSEKSAFWFGGGAGVKGFATAGVVGSTTGKGGASYGWWAGFLHNFVVPNASWIGRFISLGEVLIGVALILGLFTGAAAFAGLSLNIIYMFTGSAGVNPMYAILSVLLVLAWRNAGWIGLDRFIFNDDWTVRRLRADLGHAIHRRGHPQVPAVGTPH